MTEDDAKAWLNARYDRGRIERLSTFARLLVEESGRQNLISSQSMSALWARHIVDSAQLIDMAPENGLWIDIGTGAGLPGIVVAILRDAPVLMVEPRRMRVAFLQHCLDEIGLTNGSIECAKSNAVAAERGPATVISARAVASISTLFSGASHLSEIDTLWLLPKGEQASVEIQAARRQWKGTFHVEHSITHPVSRIVVARGVSAR